MNQIKRDLRFNRFYYQPAICPQDKIGTDVQITLIENLSNEIFYMIFDYLDGRDVYHAFLNLNERFQQLVKSSCFLLKIRFHFGMSKKQHMNKWKQFTILNKQQILSINVCLPPGKDQLCAEFTINSTFSRLESLALRGIHSDQIMSLLIELPCLPRLFSLTINYTADHLKDLTNIYQMVFTLPLLKYFKFASSDVDNPTSLSPATHKQFSTIEYMVMCHCCTFEELSNIISYTPQLRRLDFSQTYEIDLSYETILPLPLPNLTYLRIRIHYLLFDVFEIFLRGMDSKLKVLYVCVDYEDSSYLDSDQWEELIINYLPHLEKFSLVIYEHLEGSLRPSPCIEEPIQFNSSFWIERQMIVNTAIEDGFIKYSIQPLKKRWYEDTHDKIINSSVKHSQSNQLSFDLYSILCGESDEALIERIYYTSSVSLFYHVEISFDKICIGLLIQIIDILPQLISLKLHSLSLTKPTKLSSKEIDSLSSRKNTSQIKYVYLEKMIKIEDIDFLMKLCPSMVYLKIDYENKINVEIFVRNILKKIDCKLNQHLHGLCFHIPTADNEMIKKFQNMIDSEKLLVNYTIQRDGENIYLQWK
ncbi:unnamed protein product [Adineta steineri]|uniref:F-box domain-containing protein n=1 Tax=Adineta steineri TaxID=433720 RepID=A0A815GWR1_9BILA|nr:unnamed protein product [Adineta steineri]CAF3747477.1 unnamed protein product [Adineta steineri]